MSLYSTLARFTGFRSISKKEPHYLKWWEVEKLFRNLKLIAKHDIPLPYPLCLYKIRVFEVE